MANTGRVNAEVLNVLGSDYFSFPMLVNDVCARFAILGQEIPTEDEIRRAVAYLETTVLQGEWVSFIPGRGWHKFVSPSTTPTIDPYFVNPITGMTPAEQEIHTLLTAIQTNAADLAGPILVRLQKDLSTMVASAQFPTMSAQWMGDLAEGNWTLLCPTCHEMVESDDELCAVDFAERWTYASDFEGHSDAAPGETLGSVNFWFSDHGEFGDTAYYLHNGHPVKLPENWEVTV